MELAASLERWSTGSVPSRAQRVKDPAWELHLPRGGQKRREKKKKKKKKNITILKRKHKNKRNVNSWWLVFFFNFTLLLTSSQTRTQLRDQCKMKA